MLDKSLTVSEKLLLLRNHFNLSQRAFAELLGVSGGTVAAYESRREIMPHRSKLRTWAQRFGIPYSWFLDGDDGPPPISRDHVEAEKLAAAIEAEGYRLEAQRSLVVNERHGPKYGSRSDQDESNIVSVRQEDQTYEEEDFALASDMVEIPVWQGVLANLDEAHFIEEKRPRKMHVPPFFFSRKNPSRFVVGLPKGTSMAPRIVSPDRVIVQLASEAQPNSIVVARRSDNVNFVKVLRIDRMGQKELHSINPEFPPILGLKDWTMRGVVVGIWKPYIHDGTNIEFNGGMPLRA